MIDTHTHIYMEEDFPGEEGEAAVTRALDAGVGHMVFPAVDRESLSAITKLHSKFPSQTSVSLGLHPTEVGTDWREEADEILAGINEEGVVAVGEVGMDLHEDATYRAEQMEAFGYQIRKAYEHNLPLIIHQRDALNETIEVLEKAEEEGLLPKGLLFHCFTGTQEDAQRIIEAFPQAKFGIGGVATFKNARALKEALPVIGLERMVLETDAPWLAPVPMRGRRNESALLPYIAQSVAETLGVSLDEVITVTDRNAVGVFGPRVKRG